MKRIGYIVMIAVAALAIAGCHCKDKCCGTCKTEKEAVKKACCGTCDKAKEAVKKACCGTCGGAKKVEAPAQPAPDKPKDHPAH